MTEKAPMPPKGDLELYEEAKTLHKDAYLPEAKDKEEYKKKTGHMLQGLFGKGVWTLKDLNNGQLKAVIALSEKKISKTK